MVKKFIKLHLLALLYASLCFLAQIVWMHEEYNSVLSTPTEADKIGRFGRYRYIGKTQISANIQWCVYGEASEALASGPPFSGAPLEALQA